jgi:hypothetical protein
MRPRASLSLQEKLQAGSSGRGPVVKARKNLLRVDTQVLILMPDLIAASLGSEGECFEHARSSNTA